MTWTASVMPDDALDPESLVGRMRGVMPPAPPATPEPLPLWEVMTHAWSAQVVLAPNGDRLATAAEIEALRDWLPDMPPQDLLQQWCDAVACYDLAMVRSTMDWIRAQLTQQARIARGEP